MDESWNENISFIQRKRGIILLHDGYQYYKQKDYKNLQSRWACVKRKAGCTGVVNVEVNKAIQKHPHTVCKKDEATNLVAKMFYELKEKICYGAIGSVPEEYRKTVEALKNAGVNEAVIPSFKSVKHRLYTAKMMSSSV